MTILYGLLSIVDFSRTDEVFLFFFDDGLLGSSDSWPESDSLLILCIGDEVIVVSNDSDGTLDIIEKYLNVGFIL